MMSPILKETVLALHDELLVEHGGADGMRDEGVLDAVLKRAGRCKDVARAAAAYAAGIAEELPFLGCNTATGMATAETFLVLNGQALAADGVEIAMTMMKIADGRMTEAQLAEWFGERISAPMVEA